ncbi:hypothetical protein BV22DRAFT_68329 [Leucogyrophana mollusca]|uniref:Uncharacterized protein n=1 Tax=Leucogyrophana mollusca TaxID=85980 RepID=A0ACB8BWD4_9AGAM|nr:hypothetical protein BV22DRAFT_68329 [Leucogyrophana mollusca]
MWVFRVRNCINTAVFLQIPFHRSRPKVRRSSSSIMHTSTTVVIACVLTAALAGARPNPNVAPDVVQDYKYEYDYSMTLTSGFNGSGHTQQWPGWIKTSKKSRECEKCITVESDVKGSLKSLWFQPWESSMYVSLFKDTKCHASTHLPLPDIMLCLPQLALMHTTTFTHKWTPLRTRTRTRTRM